MRDIFVYPVNYAGFKMRDIFLAPRINSYIMTHMVAAVSKEGGLYQENPKATSSCQSIHTIN